MLYLLLRNADIVILAAVSGSALAWIIHDRSSATQPRSDDVLAGLVFQLVGTLYAVLVAFVIYIVWGHYDSSSRVAQLEAAALTDVARIALGLPEPARSGIRERVEHYTRRVIDEEWPSMREWKEAPDALQAYRQLWDYALAVKVTGSQELVAYEYCLTHLSKVRDLRMERVAQLSLSVSWYTWTVLILLGSSLVVLASFLACASRRSRVWQVGLLAVTLALLLTLIADLDHPWSGLVRITPEPYEAGLRYWKG